MDDLSTALGLPDHVKETAMETYKKAFDDGLLPGRSIKGFVAASIYYACRATQFPRPLEELLGATTTKAREVRHTYRILVRHLKDIVPQFQPEGLVPYYVGKLAFSKPCDVEKRATGIIEKIKSHRDIEGKDPRGWSAAAIYLAAKELDEHRTQSEIARMIGVTEVTIRSRVTDFKEVVSLGPPERKKDLPPPMICQFVASEVAKEIDLSTAPSKDIDEAIIKILEKRDDWREKYDWNRAAIAQGTRGDFTT